MAILTATVKSFYHAYLDLVWVNLTKRLTLFTRNSRGFSGVMRCCWNFGMIRHPGREKIGTVSLGTNLHLGSFLGILSGKEGAQW